MRARKTVSPEKLKAADEYVFYRETPAVVLWLIFLLLAENLFIYWTSFIVVIRLLAL